MLKTHCLSPLGEEWADRMHFNTNHAVLDILLGETAEFRRILSEFPNFPLTGYFDLRSALNNIRMEGRFLEVEELFDLKRSLETLLAIVKFFGKEKESALPLLVRKTLKVRVYPFIYERIDLVINKFGRIRDNASPELAMIRKEMVSLQSGISRKLQAILKQAQKEGWVEEGSSVSIRS